MKKLLGIAFSVIFSMLMLAGCSDKEIGIADYCISEMSVRDNQTAKDFLINAMEEKHGIKLGTTSDETRGYQIYLIQDVAYAESIGYKMSAMQDEFVIANIYDSVYILAKTPEGLNRASSYFVYNMIDESGKLTLARGESFIDNGASLKKSISVGETAIEDYTIVYSDKQVMDVCEELRYYIQQTGNAYLKIASEEDAGEHSIRLILDETLEPGKKKIEITEGQIVISAFDEKSLQDGVHLFANTYLGWMKAGKEGERISAFSSTVNIPENVNDREAWIEEREAIITLWNINYNRGFYLNTDTALENNIIDFSEEQLWEYVKMLKYCGFTGIQITEMCSAWAGAGGYETVHEKIRMMADAAHSLDMNVTLWVWGAEFNGYGWVDDSITFYKGDYDYAYQNPDVVATFEKYYSIYAELADCCDRLIGHFYDPGNLNNAEDIAFFSKMLRDKFHAVNPEIDFGISCWVDVYDKNVFVRELGNDITLYECGHHDNESDYQSFRSYVLNSGCRLGTWAWNTCEMEIDQLAQMNFNMDIIRSVYQTARNYDEIYKPSYWSEMDSYHVLNVFSLYCAGQMLINPDIESELLYQQISESTVGSEYAEAFSEILCIIQDARSGSSWDTYFWRNEDYILKSDAYPAESILARCNEYIPVLDEMIEKGIEANTLPLPISLNQLLKLMRPHLEQIRSFAEFRIAFAQLKTEYEQGADAEIIAERLYEIGEPIDSYNCIIGTWGQIEARAQREMIIAFCNETGVRLPIYGYYDKQRKDFIYAQIAMYQRGFTTRREMGAPYYQYGLAYGVEETNRLVEEMVQDGLLIRTESGAVYLADWENYIYHFN